MTRPRAGSRRRRRFPTRSLCLLSLASILSAAPAARAGGGSPGSEGIATYDAAAGLLRLKNRATAGLPDAFVRFGPPGNTWQVFTANLDPSDEQDEIVAYDPVEGLVRIKYDIGPGPADAIFRFGPADADWIATACNFDGDPEDDLVFYDPSLDPTGFRFRGKEEATGGPADQLITFIFSLPAIAEMYAGSAKIPFCAELDPSDETPELGLYVVDNGGFVVWRGFSTFILQQDASGMLGESGRDYAPFLGDLDDDAGVEFGLYDRSAGEVLVNDYPSGFRPPTFRFGPMGTSWQISPYQSGQ